MHACACALLAAFCTVSGVTVRRSEPDIPITTFLEELPPLFIPCRLTDIVTVTAPAQCNDDTSYYLYSPDNDVTKLNITTPIKQIHEDNAHRTKHSKNRKETISLPYKSDSRYRVDNVNYLESSDSKTNDVFGEKSNEFVIGPVGQEDHGNWVLSLYYKTNGSWVELFQVISIHITEHVPVRASSTSLRVGGQMTLGFVYPLTDIETCELIAPSPPDRLSDSYYLKGYSRISLSKCNYVIPNLTIHDAGTWKIIGVGKIVYVGGIFVKLNATGIRSHSTYPLIGFSSSARIIFLKYLMLPMLGHLLKMYY